jgi:hypothetical protein
VVWFLFVFFFLRVLVYSGSSWDLHSLSTQSYCVQWANHYQLMPVFAGLICGQPLPSSERSLFLNLGIYHWLVASGGHLLFIQLVLEKGGVKKNWVRSTVLLAYTMVCGFQAPILRAYTSLILDLFSKKQGLFLTRQQRNLNSGLFCLCLFPDWFGSFSFQLSWIASLAIQPKRSAAFQALNVSLFLWPLCQSWSFLHLIYNILLTPIFSLFLFPMTLFFFLLAPLLPFGNFFWQIFYKIFEHLPGEIVEIERFESSILVWIYIFSLQTVLLIYERFSK